MSAPWEVMIHSPIDSQAAYATTRDGATIHVLRGPMNVRYLRADLTCGECDSYDGRGNWRGVPDCAHRVVHTTRLEMGGSVEDEYYPPENGPACMAFVPKEGR